MRARPRHRLRGSKFGGGLPSSLSWDRPAFAAPPLCTQPLVHLPCLIAYRFAAAARWAMNPVEPWFSAQVGAQMLSILAANIAGPAVLHVGDQILLAVEPNRQHPLANLLHEPRVHYCADRRG